MAGAGVESALLQPVIVGFTMLVFTVLAMIVIDHFGRRNLMIAGSLGYVAGLSGAVWAFYAKVDGPLLRLDGVCLLRGLHGRAAYLGGTRDARNQGRVTGEDSREAPY
jgi:ribosome modulation factor